MALNKIFVILYSVDILYYKEFLNELGIWELRYKTKDSKIAATLLDYMRC
jgi:hypothetical protein